MKCNLTDQNAVNNGIFSVFYEYCRNYFLAFYNSRKYCHLSVSDNKRIMKIG